MNEYLTKPLDKKLLLSMVHKCSTTIPVLHPNMNLSLMVDVTPTSEACDPFDGSSTGVPREARHNSLPLTERTNLQRKPSRGALSKAT